MAVTGAIPLPENGMDALLNTYTGLQTNQLRQAQMQEAMGKAAQSQMLSKLLGQLSGDSGSAGGLSGGTGSMNKALLAAGALHMPTQVVEGQLITPFGNFKVGETAEEKRKGETEKTINEAQGKETVGEDKTIKESADAINDSFEDYKNLIELLKNKPNLTGLHNAFSKNAAYNVSNDPDLGTFNGYAGNILTKMTKGLSARGGVGAAKMAEKYKVEERNSTPYNLGLAKSGMQKLSSEFDALQKKWKINHPNEEFPYEKPDFDSLLQRIEAKEKAKAEKEARTYNLQTGKFE